MTLENDEMVTTRKALEDANCWRHYQRFCCRLAVLTYITLVVLWLIFLLYVQLRATKNLAASSSANTTYRDHDEISKESFDLTFP